MKKKITTGYYYHLNKFFSQYNWLMSYIEVYFPSKFDVFFSFSREIESKRNEALLVQKKRPISISRNAFDTLYY